MKIEGHTLFFSSGRTEEANDGIVGIDTSGHLSGGYDNGINDKDYSASERADLADYMIALWIRYKGTKS